MNIEMGESLVASWLKHVKGCQIVQTGWRPTWFLPVEDYACAQRWLEGLNNNLKQKGFQIFPKCRKMKKDAQEHELDACQILGMAECDVVGVAFDSCGIAKCFYAFESAFHSDGLHYKATAEKVSAKLVKAILSLYFNMGAKNIEAGFITPLVKESRYEKVIEALGIIRNYFSNNFADKFRCSIDFYTECDLSKKGNCEVPKSFIREVVNPLIRRIPLADDESELFMRSMLMRELCQGNKLPVRSSLRSAIRSADCRIDEVENLSEDCLNKLSEPNEKNALSGYRAWLKKCSIDLNFADSARRVSDADKVKYKQEAKPRKGARNGL